jgi:hypothetical protein
VARMGSVLQDPVVRSWPRVLVNTGVERRVQVSLNPALEFADTRYPARKSSLVVAAAAAGARKRAPGTGPRGYCELLGIFASFGLARVVVGDDLLSAIAFRARVKCDLGS